MTLRILSTSPATDDEWDTIWKNCDYATYFHSREWADLWQKYTYGKIKPSGRMINFSDGTSVLLPFSSRSLLLGFLKQAFSSPAGTFGGWLSLSELSEAHGSMLYKHIVSTYKNLLWRLNPYDPIVGRIRIKTAMHEETLALDLEAGFQAIYKKWTTGNSSAARKARKAQKAGVEIREASSIQDWKDYFEVYQDSLNRWGGSASYVYQWSLFQAMYELQSPRIKLWLAIYKDQVVSGALCFYAKRHVVYWHGASLSEYFNLRPVNLLLYEIIRDACECGYQWFDFNPSGGHEGVENFKKSFGALKFECPVVQNRSKAVWLARKLARIIDQ